MNECEELAEIIGIILGDGSIYCNKSKNVYQLRIAGNSETDKEYLIHYMKPLIERIFKTKVRIKFHSTCKEMFLCVNRKNIILELKKFGLFPGNKKKNNHGIPSWIFKKNKYIKSCLRGLIDTDGSLCPKTPNHPCSSIWFKSCIPNLRKDFSKSFNILNFHWSKWTDTNRINTKQCCLGRSTEVIRYYKEIGFKNIKHIRRFHKFAKVPVV